MLRFAYIRYHQDTLHLFLKSSLSPSYIFSTACHMSCIRSLRVVKKNFVYRKNLQCIRHDGGAEGRQSQAIQTHLPANKMFICTKKMVVLLLHNLRKMPTIRWQRSFRILARCYRRRIPFLVKIVSSRTIDAQRTAFI